MIKAVSIIIFVTAISVGDTTPAVARAMPGGRQSSLGTTLGNRTKLRKSIKPRKRRRVRRRRRTRLHQLSDGPGFRVRRGRYAWGTQLTLSHLRNVFAAFHQFAPSARPFWIQDISKRRGGKMGPHLSHRRGTDVDIRLPHKRYSRYYRKATPRSLHRAYTWFVIDRLIKTGDVQFIFLDRRLQRALYRFARKRGVSRKRLRRIFQWPRRHGGIVRHWRSHEDHMHVRFRRGKLRPMPKSFFSEAQCMVNTDGHPMYAGTGS